MELFIRGIVSTADVSPITKEEANEFEQLTRAANRGWGLQEQLGLRMSDGLLEQQTVTLDLTNMQLALLPH